MSTTTSTTIAAEKEVIERVRREVLLDLVEQVLDFMLDNLREDCIPTDAGIEMLETRVQQLKAVREEKVPTREDKKRKHSSGNYYEDISSNEDGDYKKPKYDVVQVDRNWDAKLEVSLRQLDAKRRINGIKAHILVIQ